jgi:hypothetical protein
VKKREGVKERKDEDGWSDRRPGLEAGRCVAGVRCRPRFARRIGGPDPKRKAMRDPEASGRPRGAVHVSLLGRPGGVVRGERVWSAARSGRVRGGVHPSLGVEVATIPSWVMNW